MASYVGQEHVGPCDRGVEARGLPFPQKWVPYFMGPLFPDFLQTRFQNYRLKPSAAAPLSAAAFALGVLSKGAANESSSEDFVVQQCGKLLRGADVRERTSAPKARTQFPTACIECCRGTEAKPLPGCHQQCIFPMVHIGIIFDGRRGGISPIINSACARPINSLNAEAYSPKNCMVANWLFLELLRKQLIGKNCPQVLQPQDQA